MYLDMCTFTSGQRHFSAADCGTGAGAGRLWPQVTQRKVVPGNPDVCALSYCKGTVELHAAVAPHLWHKCRQAWAWATRQSRGRFCQVTRMCKPFHLWQMSCRQWRHICGAGAGNPGPGPQGNQRKALPANPDVQALSPLAWE